MPKLIGTMMAAFLLLTAAVHAGPQAELWERWLPHDPSSTEAIDHGAWESFLLRYLRIGADGVHRLAYAEVTPGDRTLLDGYIEKLAAVPIGEYDRNEQMAYWINLYNALVVRLVVEHYPVASILDIEGRPGGRDGPWDLELVAVDGTPVSLDDIEHRILRPIWRDPRVHYALSCGAVGCPNLQPEPFRSDRIEQQLTKAAMAYINGDRCLKVEEGRLVVSSMYGWHKQDFGGSDRGIINHLMAYAEPRLAMQLQHFEQVQPDLFDWRLNDASYAQGG